LRFDRVVAVREPEVPKVSLTEFLKFLGRTDFQETGSAKSEGKRFSEVSPGSSRGEPEEPLVGFHAAF
jgi:hypothetical protein